MAWFRAMGAPIVNDPRDVIKNGILNTDYYYLSGAGISQGADYVLVSRSDPTNGGAINNTDVTSYTSVVIQYQQVDASAQLQIYFGGTRYHYGSAGTDRRTVSIGISSLTGVQNMSFLLSSNGTSAKLYSIKFY